MDTQIEASQLPNFPVISRKRFAELVGVSEGVVAGWINRGYPDSNLLNRHEKYEVLYFINAFLQYHKLNSVADGYKVERMIKTHLPSDIRSHVNVHNWITNNWNKYV